MNLLAVHRGRARIPVLCALIIGLLTVSPMAATADPGEATGAATKSAMSKIASGNGYSCRVIDGGHVTCWGRNVNGQLGIGSTDAKASPTLVGLGGSTATAVAIGAVHTCALLSDTTVKCWGRGEFGRIGDGNGVSTDRTLPVSVCADAGCTTNLTGVSSLALSYEASCALKSDGTVWCWGDNNDWQLGSDPATSVTGSTYARQVTGLSSIKSISAGDYHTCVIKSDDTPWCWGTGSMGQLGNGSTSPSAPSAVTISGVTTVKAIAAGYGHTCVIKSDDVVGCWGSNWNGETGSGTLTMYELSLVTPQVGGSSVTAKALSITGNSTCVITTSDEVACWGGYMDGGSNTAAGLGGYSGFSAKAREVVTGTTGTVALAVGHRHSCAVLSDSTMTCWGRNQYTPTTVANEGALGNNSTTNSTEAVVLSLTGSQPTITVSDPGAKGTVDSTFTVTATNSSGVDTLLFAYDSSICNFTSATTVTIYSAGSCRIGASSNETISGRTKFFQATSSTRTVTISQSTPAVSTAAATSITSSTATLNGTVNAALASSTVTWAWGTSDAVSAATTVVGSTHSGSATASVSQAITGLSAGTKYWYWVKGTNSAGTSVSTAGTFTTSGSVPVVATGSTSSVSSNRATLNGTVNPGEMETAAWFTWGEKQDLSDGKRVDYRSITGSTDTDASVTVTGLTESTRYYYRIEASNGLGSAKGDIKSFTASRPVGISVNDAAEFTNKKSVTIFATGPTGSTQVIISNDGGFKSSQTFTLTDGYAEVPWTLVASRDERLPKTVYARFVQRFGTQSSTNTDDIILDTTAPVMSGTTGTATSSTTGSVTVQGIRLSAARGGVRLTVRAKDANSGIGTVQVKGSSGGRPVDVATGSPKAASRTVRVNTTKKKLWVRVVDRAGNVSKWVTVTVK